MSNKFAAALKAKKPSAEAIATSEPRPQADQPSAVSKRAPSRRSSKHIGGYFDPVVSRQLKSIALEEDSSVQALLGEALDLLFQSRRKPMIASKSKAE